MNAPRTSTRFGIVLGGLLIAFGLACLAIFLRQRFTSGPDAQAMSGMYAFGDMMVGMAVFAAAGVLPLGLGLYWLRSVEKFWSALAWLAVGFAASGVLAVAVRAWMPNPTAGWILFFSFARVCVMPFSTLGLLACAVMAPLRRHRWLLAGSAAADGAVFAGVVLVKFVLPSVGVD